MVEHDRDAQIEEERSPDEIVRDRLLAGWSSVEETTRRN